MNDSDGLFEDPEFMAFGKEALEKMMAPTKGTPIGLSKQPKLGIFCVICNRRVQQSNFTQTLGRLRPLIEHVKTHLDQRNYQCSECGYEAKTYVCASIHVKRMHDAPNGRVLDNSDEKYLFQVFEKAKQAFPEVQPLIEEYFEQNKNCWLKAIQMKGSSPFIPRSPTKNETNIFFPNLPTTPKMGLTTKADFEPCPSSLDDILNTISAMENFEKRIHEQSDERMHANLKVEHDFEAEASCSTPSELSQNGRHKSENGSRSSSEDAPPQIKRQRVQEPRTPTSPSTGHPSLEIKKLYQLLALKDRQLTEARKTLVEMHQKEKQRKQKLIELESENDKLIRILGQRELDKTKYEEKIFDLNLRLETFLKATNGHGHEEEEECEEADDC
ncbi:unnamed protein product, partial [Mesorhabditis belari]|uniref:C2H2-type domain-containing protein n=1 Tax=Mesorhabditis belari TaxID=2138241 RepID=A0AAF3ESF1_9BILA